MPNSMIMFSFLRSMEEDVERYMNPLCKMALNKLNYSTLEVNQEIQQCIANNKGIATVNVGRDFM